MAVKMNASGWVIKKEFWEVITQEINIIMSKSRFRKKLIDFLSKYATVSAKVKKNKKQQQLMQHLN